MKVYIANPPFFSKFNRQVRWSAKTSGALHPPIFIAYAAANLKKNGFNVKLKDAIAEEMDIDSFVSDVVKFKPDILFLETSTPSIMNDSKIAKEIKLKLKDIKIVFMGSHASALPIRTLKESIADAVCMGEYDVTVVEMAEAVKNKKSFKGIKGVAYKSGNAVNMNDRRELIEDLSTIPWPLREQLPIGQYKDTLLTDPFTFIITTRGCPYKCIYCNWPKTMFGNRARYRDAIDVVDEVEHCIKTYNLKTYKFFDDTFTIDKKHVIDICNELIRRGIKTPWICNARADKLDLEMLSLMKKAGCYLMKIGVESGNQEILDWTKKGTKLDVIRKFFKLTRKVGIQTFASFMIGYPQETDETIKKTLDFAKEIGPDMAQFVILQPLPGTPLWSELEDKRMIPKEIDWSKYITKEGYVDLVFEHPTYSREELRDLTSKMWKSYYVRPSYIFKRFVKSLTSISEMKRNIHGVKKVFRYNKKKLKEDSC
jgi:anaerobic magnesium-protoporphyrin IX monomethyl ester cyclase